MIQASHSILLGYVCVIGDMISVFSVKFNVLVCCLIYIKALNTGNVSYFGGK